jgi:hypothetical protein
MRLFYSLSSVLQPVRGNLAPWRELPLCFQMEVAMNEQSKRPTAIRPSRKGEIGRFMSRENISNMLRAGSASDLTDYVLATGYRGSRRVIVMDGRVVTHRWLEWPDFLQLCRRRSGNGFKANQVCNA